MKEKKKLDVKNFTRKALFQNYSTIIQIKKLFYGMFIGKLVKYQKKIGVIGNLEVIE
jgi:hypothetical protein